jgi:hypothetical protein
MLSWLEEEKYKIKNPKDGVSKDITHHRTHNIALERKKDTERKSEEVISN